MLRYRVSPKHLDPSTSISVSLSSSNVVIGAASSTSDSVMSWNGSFSSVCWSCCWTAFSCARPEWQGWLGFKQCISSSSEPSTASVNAQLLKEFTIMSLSKSFHASRIHWTISRLGGAHVSYMYIVPSTETHFFSGDGGGGGRLFEGGRLLQILNLRRGANSKRGAYLKLGANSSIYGK